MIYEKDYNWLAIESGAAKYDVIMKSFNIVDVSKDEKFQKTFTGFYRIRRSKELFLSKYYKYMESLKGKNVTFSEIIKKVYSFKGSIEPSFSSKMLATLDPNMPVWDQYVLINSGIGVPSYYGKTIEKCISIYEQIILYYKRLLKSQDAKDMLNLFNKKLPEYKHFTDIKKIDLMLWQKR